MIPNSTDPKKTWFCECQKHCKGGKYVQKRTYDRHAAIREVEEQVNHAEHIRRFGAAQSSIPDFTRRRRRKQKKTPSISVHFPSQPASEQAGLSSTSQQNCPMHENNFSDHETDIDIPVPQEPDFDALHASVDGFGQDLPPVDTTQLQGIWDQNRREDDEMEQQESDAMDETPDNENSIPNTLEDGPLPNAHIPVLQLAQKLVENIKTAKLEDDITDEGLLHSLRNPENEMPELDRLTMLALKIFNGLVQGTQQMYNDVRDALLWYSPSLCLDSYYVMQKKIAKITGVYQITTDMCPNSCVAYTGPFATFTECPKCKTPRYHSPPSGTRRKNRKHAPKQQFYTFPLGPQLQALWRSPRGAHELRYRNRKTEEILDQLKQTGGKIPIYEDIFHGTEYINALRSGQILDDDTLVMVSIDGAQLYHDKASDCWFGIWIILDLSPEIRYKKQFILPALIVPGPNPPDITECFLLPAFRHCSALQKEGLRAWDGKKSDYIISRPFFGFGTADTVGIVVLNGFVGHNGGHGCRLHCGFHGRHKPNQGTYYAAALRPDRYTVKSCMHPDFDIEKIGSPNIDVYKRSLRLLMLSMNESEYKKRRLLTGIVKPSICLGFQDECMLSVPSCFPLDLMHLISLNIPQHLVQVWRNSGEVKIQYTVKPDFIIFDDDSVWQKHGALVASATPYLPTAFERPPRNPAEKINLGYKAMEFLLYLWGLGPAVFVKIML
ncbi:hypothetical protein AX14_006395 [Amanita brunnescens Koide BX004]|nr:hypothetical protein AX14_006395 [Amanita brunnescens Koide BX004]